MKLKVGQSLASVTDTTTVVVIRAPNEDVELTCGKVAMVDPKSDAAKERQPLESADPEGTQLGKRYVDDDSSIELLCTKAGPARLALNGKQLSIKAAKPLPASD
jgi:hypothetical protein